MIETTNKGSLIWITGLSGSGKSSLAKALISQLKQATMQPLVHLDGDDMRWALQKETNSHSLQEREALAFTYSRWCKLLSSQGMLVVCSTISMFDSVRQWNRNNIAHYFEIYLKTDINNLIHKNSKNIYQDTSTLQLNNHVVGTTIKPEVPTLSDIVIENFLDSHSERDVKKIIETMKKKELIQ